MYKAITLTEWDNNWSKNKKVIKIYEAIMGVKIIRAKSHNGYYYMDGDKKVHISYKAMLDKFNAGFVGEIE